MCAIALTLVVGVAIVWFLGQLKSAPETPAPSNAGATATQMLADAQKAAAKATQNKADESLLKTAQVEANALLGTPVSAETVEPTQAPTEVPTAALRCKSVEGMNVENKLGPNGLECYYFMQTATPEPSSTPAPTATTAPTASPEPSATPTATAPIDLENVLKMAKKLPFETIQQVTDKGAVTTLKGFDLTEFGGLDNKCKRNQTEVIHLGEVVSSETESCRIVVEWSLKYGTTTVLAGTYAVEPGEWFYVPLAVGGENDSPRIVGTIWYLPRNWNSHLYAAYLAIARDARDGTLSYVGLSPTDPFVELLANALLQP